MSLIKKLKTLLNTRVEVKKLIEVLIFGIENNEFNTNSFGGGFDGNAVVDGVNTYSWLAVGTNALLRDVFLNNLTIKDNGFIQTNGYRIFVKDTLDISQAQPKAISAGNGLGVFANSLNGADAVSSSAALGNLSGINSKSLGISNGSGNGGNGTSTVGSQAGSLVGFTSPTQYGQGGQGGSGGAGGNGVSNGGARRLVSGYPNTLPIKYFTNELVMGINMIYAGAGGTGGSGGGGDNTNNGGGGGAGGVGAAVMYIACKKLVRGNSGVISANGGNGGNGFSPISGNCGGGGGGGAGGGGWIYLAYSELLGNIATNLITVNGGKGGDGGNGIGTGIGGNGGDGGQSGRITIIDVTNATVTETTPSNGTAGTTGSGINKGLGGAGAINQISL